MSRINAFLHPDRHLPLPEGIILGKESSGDDDGEKMLTPEEGEQWQRLIATVAKIRPDIRKSLMVNLQSFAERTLEHDRDRKAGEQALVNLGLELDRHWDKSQDFLISGPGEKSTINIGNLQKGEKLGSKDMQRMVTVSDRMANYISALEKAGMLGTVENQGDLRSPHSLRAILALSVAGDTMYLLREADQDCPNRLGGVTRITNMQPSNCIDLKILELGSSTRRVVQTLLQSPPPNNRLR